MIRVNALSKKYKRKKNDIIALDNISFNVQPGEIFGIIGPTGAGKTTLLKILSTLIIPDSGEVLIDGFDVLKQEGKVREKIGVVVGEFTRTLYWRLTGRENMNFFAQIKGIQRPKKEINRLLEQFDLSEYADMKLMMYSTGMKHKLALAIALLNDPPILLLDEPLTGVDPLTSFEIKQLIKKRFRKKSIIWTSHNLYEIEEMCNRILLLNKGRNIVTGKVEKLKQKYWDYNKIIISTNQKEPLLILPNSKINDFGKIEIQTYDNNQVFQKLLRIIEKNDIFISEISTKKPSLENIFMNVIKNDN